jgi:acyl-CoA dehydrogenase
MDFAFSDRSVELQGRVRRFMQDYVLPHEHAYHADVSNGIYPPQVVEDLKALAKDEGLWNFFLPALPDDAPGTGLSNLDYAPLAEIMGRVYWASEVFNCNAPDTGNMELLHLFATPAQKERWLKPLFEGEIRSCFMMTEPDVASSDATNIQFSIRRDGDEYVLDGRKWFITNALDPRAKLGIVLGVTDPDGPRHKQHTQVMFPMNTPGIEIERNISYMNHLAPEGTCEVVFRGARVGVENLLGEEGAGFALAQARLGPGRIHHCMRSIGQCEVALDLMCQRALERRAFGKYLHEYGNIGDWIAKARIDIEQARLLVLKTAWIIDQKGNREARKEISMITALVPPLQTKIVNRAIQVFGAMGLSPDTPLPYLWSWGRALQILDGPDEVHLRAVAHQEIKRAQEERGDSVIPEGYRQSRFTPPIVG